VIGADTRLVGLIGDPVAHSLSPRMHNAAFHALGLDYAYLPLRVEAQRLDQALAGLAALSFVAANVTIPHKQAVAARIATLTDPARTAGSVNTIIVDQDGTLSGASTDGEAVVSAVRDAAGDALLTGDALVLGAGGAARCAVAALRAAGMRVAVHARRHQQARRLADELDATALAQLPRPAPALIVNATPLGGSLALRQIPIPADALNGASCVCDLAYRADRQPTLLAAEAARRGLFVVDGREVLARQGALAFRLFTGRDAPLDVMRAAVAA
jgi:shikimate dehydrogenase